MSSCNRRPSPACSVRSPTPWHTPARSRSRSCSRPSWSRRTSSSTRSPTRARSFATSAVAKIAVIGAGVMGLATGWALRRRGHEPVVYEQFEVGNPHGSSHGRSRIFRLAYAEDEYVRLAQEALGLWRELEAESGEA